MTRRTDWAEYEYAASGAPRGRGTGERTGSAVDGEDTHEDIAPDAGLDARGRLHGGDRLHGGSGPHGDDPYGGDDPHAHEDPHGYAHPYGYDDRREDGGAYGGDTPRPPRGDSRGGGTRRGRGRRRRGFGEAADAEDGGALASSRAEQEAPPGDPVEQARAICLRLLTGTPRTRKQLADALRKRQIPDEAAEEVLSRFEEVGLINDSAFADAWVESRHHGRGLARRALARELRTKGVDSTLIDEAVSRLDSEQEEATARELVDRKLRSTRGLDRDKRLRRLAGMLARKGYPEGMALRVVRQALEEEGEDPDFPVGDEF